MPLDPPSHPRGLKYVISDLESGARCEVISYPSFGQDICWIPPAYYIGVPTATALPRQVLRLLHATVSLRPLGEADFLVVWKFSGCETASAARGGSSFFRVTCRHGDKEDAVHRGVRLHIKSDEPAG